VGSSARPRAQHSGYGVAVVVGVVVAVLLAFAHGYGYHRDELYFVACGKHLAWGYADQGPLVPLIARVMTAISATSLTVLRIPAALAAGATVYVASRLPVELGAPPRARLIAAGCTAVASLTLVTGHWLSTSTFDLLGWTVIGWLAVRAIVRDQPRLWLAVGAVLGVALLDNPLPAFLAVALVAGVAIAGPRRLLASPWVWAGALIAVVIWSPWLIWQGRHGWPQLDVSSSIAAGNSTSSQPWWAILPFQFLLVSPVLAPVWIAGLVAAFRDRRLRFLGWGWALLAVAFMATQGKPYYLGNLLPVLLGVGAVPVEAWLRGRVGRRRLLVAAVALSAVICGVIALPVLPTSAVGPVLAANADVGETIGWPALVRTVAKVRHSVPGPVTVLAANYGEAGAIDRFGGAYGLPHAYSGHDAYGYWGPPRDTGRAVLVIGYRPSTAAQYLHDCRLAARVHTGVDDDENGAPVLVCAGPRTSWAAEWRHLRRLG
jgi:hypothetical protein